MELKSSKKNTECFRQPGVSLGVIVLCLLCDLHFGEAGNSRSEAAVHRSSVLPLVEKAWETVPGHPLRVFGFLTES